MTSLRYREPRYKCVSATAKSHAGEILPGCRKARRSNSTCPRFAACALPDDQSGYSADPRASAVCIARMRFKDQGRGSTASYGIGQARAGGHNPSNDKHSPREGLRIVNYRHLGRTASHAEVPEFRNGRALRRKAHR